MRDARQRTMKHREHYDLDGRYHLSVAGRAFIAGIGPADAMADELNPAVT